MSKQITIPVPDGKRAEWINGVLTLVDEQIEKFTEFAPEIPILEV